MANFSDHTRKEQVESYLRTRLNSWVDGPELANEQVGGSEGLKRLRELRKELRDSRFEIEMRAHPDPSRDIFQYRMVDRPVAYTEPAPASPMQAANGTVSDVRAGPERSPQRLNAPDRRSTPAFQNERGHLAYDPETETYIAVYDGPPVVLDEEAVVPVVPGQSEMGVPTDDGLKYTVMPTKLDFGKSRPCPKCHGLHRAINEMEPDPTDPKKQRAVKVLSPTGKLVNKVIGYESFTRDPSKPSRECPRCNGFGLIPA